jgi:DNA polymerase-3 subunit gamma/tau
MTALHEQYRPAAWSDVVGQDKAIATIDRLRERGLGGRAFFISGGSGTGKTTIARLLAAEVEGPLTATVEIDSGDLTAAVLDKADDHKRLRAPLGGGCFVYIVNEVHGLRAPTIRKLLGVTDPIPDHVMWIYTTTSDGQAKLFDDQIDAHPLLSRCQVLPLARRDLAKPMAARLQWLARTEGLDGQPMAAYVKLLQSCKNNMREAIQRIEAGEMRA